MVVTYPPPASRELLDDLHIIYPITLFIVFVIIFFAGSGLAVQDVRNNGLEVLFGPGGKPLPKRLRSTMNGIIEAQREAHHQAKRVFMWPVMLILGIYVADAALQMTHVIIAKSEQWWCGQETVIYIIGSFFMHAVVLISLLDTTPSPTFIQSIPWAVAALFESGILAASIFVYTNVHREPIVGNPYGGPERDSITRWEFIEVILGSVRVLILILLVTAYLFKGSLFKKSSWKTTEPNSPTESTGLLDSSSSESEDDSYGSTSTYLNSRAPEPWARPTATPSTTWKECLSGYMLFLQYFWPSKSRRLQLVVVFCFSLLIVQRAVNVLVPYQVGVITNMMSFEEGMIQIPWLQICLYIFYRWLQGNQGLIESIRSSMWISVSRYSYMELSTAAFEHVHNLSLDFQLSKKMGEVLSALTKDSSVNTFLEQITFGVVPMILDLGTAIGYFLVAFDVYYALVITIVTLCYLYITISLAKWRIEIRRQMVNSSKEDDAARDNSLTPYETVKYFNGEDYEIERYRDAVSRLLDAEWHSLFAQSLMGIYQNTIFMIGLMIISFIAAYQVSTGQRPVSQFVTLLVYMAQLQTPLSFFHTIYRYIQPGLINIKRLLELFREQPSVIDKPSAIPLPICRGGIVFENVKFSYNTRRPALDGLTFYCQPGTITALVGEFEGGKSAIFHLLFRFYNAESGRILIDAHDVQEITITSLRKHIGIVPRHTIFFNGSLMDNIKYAKRDATDEEVYEACRAANIHDKIMSFPGGYATMVGERSMRLSEGERQRVAIAQTILKNPSIVLLDEATTSLDTETQEHIQQALSNLSEGRTVLIIAHRLSTITTADRILVLHKGQIAESGTHEQLLTMGGRYSNMWQKQIRAQRDARQTSRSPSQSSGDLEIYFGI